MLLHIDGSKHQWFGDQRWYDLIVILDDANSEIYYAQLVEEESTRTVMAGLREVIEAEGLFALASLGLPASHGLPRIAAGSKMANAGASEQIPSDSAAFVSTSHHRANVQSAAQSLLGRWIRGCPWSRLLLSWTASPAKPLRVLTDFIYMRVRAYLRQ